jgi:hypothetical protein
MRYVAVIAGLFALLAVTQPAAAREHHGGGEGWRGSSGREMHGREMRGFEARGHESRGYNSRGYETRGHETRRPDMHGRSWRGNRPPLDRFLPDIRRRHPGRLLDVEPGWGVRGEPHNRIKWLTPDGRVLWLDQDARTGEILGVEGAPSPHYAPWRR